MTKLTKQENIDKLNGKILKDDHEIAEITNRAVIYSDGIIEPIVPGAGYEGKMLDNDDFTQKQYRVIKKETGLIMDEVDIMHGLEGILYWNKKGKKPKYAFSKESMKEMNKLSEDKNENYVAGYNSKKYSEALDKLHDKLKLEARKEETEEFLIKVRQGKI